MNELAASASGPAGGGQAQRAEEARSDPDAIPMRSRCGPDLGPEKHKPEAYDKIPRRASFFERQTGLSSQAARTKKGPDMTNHDIS